MTLLDKLLTAGARRVGGGVVRWATSPDATWSQRRRRQLVTAAIPPARGVTRDVVALAGVPAERYEPPARTPHIRLLYLHGGAYVLGSPRAYRHLVTRLTAASRLATWSLDYRLAPEAPFPAALEDALAAYTELCDDGRQQVVVAGDSAGAGLALALARAANERGLPAPAALGLISPWLDLTAEAGRRRPDSVREAFITPWLLEAGAAAYARATARHDPAISPLLGNYGSLPPIVLDICSDDLIAEDGRRLERGLRAAGGWVDAHEHADRWHVFHLLAGVLPSASDAVEQFGRRTAHAARTQSHRDTHAQWARSQRPVPHPVTRSSPDSLEEAPWSPSPAP